MSETFRDASRTVAERVEDLLGRMTLAEKVAQLACVEVPTVVGPAGFDPDHVLAAVPDGIGQVARIGASSGLRAAARAQLYNDLQKVMVEGTRLGIPLLLHEESAGGFCARDASVFPQAIGLAATWDPALVEEVASVIGDQMRSVGARQTLAPVLDVARDPRWGRVEETYGEDPVLAGTIGVAYVRGVQGADLAGGVAATGKHFLGYGLPEGGRNWAPVQLGPRELREVYAEPFAAAVREAGLASVMNSYSSVDGLPCAGAPSLLTDLLRGELGFDGTVVADYYAVRLLMTHHRVAADKQEAAVLALTAGLDVELPRFDCFRTLADAVGAGRLPAAAVDRAVARVLELKLRLGLFEQPYVDADAAGAVCGTGAQRGLARRAAAASVVVLANDGVLPLGAGVGTVAVVGPGADDPRLLQGDYHYPAHQELLLMTAAPAAAPTPDGEPLFLWPEGLEGGVARYAGRHVTPLEAIRDAAGPHTTVVHNRGCEVTGDDRTGIAAAARAAGGADVAVVVLAGRSGLSPEATVGEARDAVDLGLTGVQEELARAVLATGTPTVVVVLSGRVHTLAGVVEGAAAAVQVWPPGEEGGHGLADVLFGVVDPSGRLPVSLPRHVGQVPVHYSYRAGGGKAMFLGEYTDCATSPLFPFGHGLSYTSFERGPVRARAGSTAEPVEVTVSTANVGDRAGVDVVQLYVTDPVASVARPERQLVGFARVPLEPGEGRRVTFRVHPARLAFFDPAMRFVTEPGRLAFSVGASSGDLYGEASVDLHGPATEFTQRDVRQTAVTLG